MKDYFEVASYGRGARSEDASKRYTVVFKPSIRLVPAEESVNVLDREHSGIEISKISAAGGRAPSGFIKLSDLTLVSEKTRNAIRVLADRELGGITSGGDGEQKKAASEYVFKFGKYSGKTPSQVLLEGEPEANLETSAKFLEERAQGKFREDNLKGVADIRAAIAAKKNGALASVASSAPAQMSIFASGPIYIPLHKPQPYVTSGTELKVTFCPSQNNPFRIEWVKKDRVTIEGNVIVKAEDVSTHTANLTAGEWFDALAAAEKLFSDTEILNRKNHLAYGFAHKDDWKTAKEQGA